MVLILSFTSSFDWGFDEVKLKAINKHPPNAAEPTLNNFETFFEDSMPQLVKMGFALQEIKKFTKQIHTRCSELGSVLYLFDVEKLLMSWALQDPIQGDTIYHFGDAARIATTQAFIHAILYVD